MYAKLGVIIHISKLWGAKEAAINYVRYLGREGRQLKSYPIPSTRTFSRNNSVKLLKELGKIKVLK